MAGWVQSYVRQKEWKVWKEHGICHCGQERDKICGKLRKKEKVLRCQQEKGVLDLEMAKTKGLRAVKRMKG